MNIRDFLTIDAGGPGSGCHGPNCGRPGGYGSNESPGDAAKSHGYVLQSHEHGPNGSETKTFAHKSGARVETRTPPWSQGGLHNWRHYDKEGNLKNIGQGGDSLHEHLAKHEATQIQKERYAKRSAMRAGADKGKGKKCPDCGEPMIVKLMGEPVYECTSCGTKADVPFKAATEKCPGCGKRMKFNLGSQRQAPYFECACGRKVKAHINSASRNRDFSRKTVTKSKANSDDVGRPSPEIPNGPMANLSKLARAYGYLPKKDYDEGTTQLEYQFPNGPSLVVTPSEWRYIAKDSGGSDRFGDSQYSLAKHLRQLHGPDGLKKHRDWVHGPVPENEAQTKRKGYPKASK